MVIVSTLVAVAGLVWAYQKQLDAPRVEFERRVRSLETLEDFRPPNVADEDNVVAGLQEIGVWLAEHDKWDRRPFIVSDESWWSSADEDEKAEGRRYLASVEPFFGKLERALTRKHFRSDVDWSAGSLVRAREWDLYDNFGQILRSRAQLARNDNDTVRSCRLLLRMSERCDIPFLGGCGHRWSMARWAVEALRTAPISDAAFVRGELDPLLARVMPERGPPRLPFEQERAVYVSVVRDWAAAKSVFTEEDRSRGQTDDAQLRPHLAPWHYRAGLRCLDAFDLFLARCETTPGRAIQAVDTFRPFSRMTLDGNARSFGAFLFRWYGEVVADVRLARQALALLEARDQTGTWPDELPGDFRDPHSGGAFVYERKRQRVVLRCGKWENRSVPDVDYEEWLKEYSTAWIFPRTP